MKDPAKTKQAGERSSVLRRSATCVSLINSQERDNTGEKPTGNGNLNLISLKLKLTKNKEIRLTFQLEKLGNAALRVEIIAPKMDRTIFTNFVVEMTLNN